MNEAQRVPVNRCFGGENCPRSQEQQKEKKIKRILLAATAAERKKAERNRAERALKDLLLQFHGRKGIDQLLPVIKLRFPPAVLQLAIERVERKQDELSWERRADFQLFKDSLQQSE